MLRAAAPFFEKRFAAMPWAILTPRGSVAWDRRSLTFGPPAAASDLPGHGTADDGDRLWLAYYRSIFNPARIKVAAMQREMPLRFWKHLPEARAIAPLLAAAPARVRAMVEHQDAPAAVRANPHADARRRRASKRCSARPRRARTAPSPRRRRRRCGAKARPVPR